MASSVLIRLGLLAMVMIQACWANQYLYTDGVHRGREKLPIYNGFDRVQSLSRVHIHEAQLALDPNSWIKATPDLLGAEKYANYSNPNYALTGNGLVSFRLINQRADFAFTLFSGDVYAPVLKSVSNAIAFMNPKAPLHPRLAIGKTWDEMTVTWTSGYGNDEGTPVLQWGPQNQKDKFLSPAGTLSYTIDDMCGVPATTIGWRDPGYIHTAFMKELGPNTKFYYRIRHMLHKSNEYAWGKEENFVAPPYPGQDSVQRIIVLGDTGKIDGSNEYANYQPGALNTTAHLEEDLNNYDAIVHVGDFSYSNGYISQWDQFNEQIKKITAHVPFMVARWLLVVTMRVIFWTQGPIQTLIRENLIGDKAPSNTTSLKVACPLLTGKNIHGLYLLGIVLSGIHLTHGMQSREGSFDEPMGRESLQNLWQKYKVYLAFWGHVYNYERLYPSFQNVVVSEEKTYYSGIFNATMHMVVGGGGSNLNDFTLINTTWSVYKDEDFGFTKLTAFNHSTLLLEYKKSSDGKVHDHFWIKRKPMDVLGCDSIQQF